MSKHTPGPWELDPYGQVTQLNGRTVLVSGIATPMVSTAESIANARLIAAAPDLLEVLKRALEEDADGHVQWQTRKDARAAIAKAEGGN